MIRLLGSVLVILLWYASVEAEVLFYDNFNDNDISDWTPICGSAIWWAEEGCARGYTTSPYPCVLIPENGNEGLNYVVSTKTKGIHATGIVSRIEGTTGIEAYVSPDHDVARIRLLANGQHSTILSSINAPFPSGVWYNLTFTCEGEDLFFEIEVPSTSQYWSLNAIDPSPQIGTVSLLMGDEPDAYWDWISVSTTGGSVSDILPIVWMNTVDEIQGNGNHAFEAGEEIVLGLEILNSTEETLSNVFAIIQSLDPTIIITGNYDEFGTIDPGSTAWGLEGFGVYAPPDTPEDEVYPLRLTVFADGGYSEQVDFDLPVGSSFSCDMESGTELWSWNPVLSGWGDNWHVSSTRNHTTAGSYSFKCGDTGSGDYDNLLYSGLSTPLFNIPLEGEMTFWMWIDAHYPMNFSGIPAYDGGLIQYGRCGTWIDLEPTCGYPYEIVSGTTGPFEDGTGVFSGISGWTEYSIVIPDSLAGPCQIRFVFGSDNAGTREGWYVDDIDIWGLTRISDPGGFQGLSMPGLTAFPNPFSESITFRISGFSEQNVPVEIFDISGRKIADLEAVEEGAEKTLLWNGTGIGGATIPAGVYFVRLPDADEVILRIVKIR